MTTTSSKWFPPELLVKIFQECLLNDPRTIRSLSLVERKWNLVMTTSPMLYQHIILYLPDSEARSLIFSRAQAFHWMRYSQPLPFDVEITVHVYNDFWPLLAPLFTTLSRLRNLTLKWGQYSVERTFTFISTPSRALVVNVTEGSSPRRRSQILPHMPSILSDSTDGELKLICEIELTSIPNPELISPNPFECLAVIERSYTSSCPPREVLRLLQGMSNLHHLHWYAWRREHSTTDLPGQVLLPHLQTLTLSGTVAIRTILSRLKTPSLREICLKNITRHHFVADEDGVSGEDGDSDDDACDFSQSPDSDRTIGMGLRALLRSSSPPLERLYMDYADMRTKDFRWTFDALNVLTAFRIIGSDFSDGVARMFAPYTPLASKDEPHPRPRVRMPWLSELDFTGALRVSGDALIESLAAREAFAQSNRGCQRLQKLVIQQCSELNAVHGDHLRGIFGDRLTFQLV